MGKCWCVVAAWCVVVGKIFVVKLFPRKIFLYVFCVQKYIFTMKKSKLWQLLLFKYSLIFTATSLVAIPRLSTHQEPGYEATLQLAEVFSIVTL